MIYISWCKQNGKSNNVLTDLNYFYVKNWYFIEYWIFRTYTLSNINFERFFIVFSDIYKWLIYHWINCWINWWTNCQIKRELLDELLYELIVE